MSIVITGSAIVVILLLIYGWPLIFWVIEAIIPITKFIVVIGSGFLALAALMEDEYLWAILLSIPFIYGIYRYNQSEKENKILDDGSISLEEFRKYLEQYQQQIANNVENPDLVSSIASSFERKFKIGEKALHLLGALEWELTWNDNEARKWRYKTIHRKDVSGEKEKTFTLKLNDLTLVLSEPEYGYDRDQRRNLKILDGKKVVAEYSGYRAIGAYYDWGEAGNVFNSKFKPGEWLLHLNNIYLSWLTEKKMIEIQEENESKKKSVEDKYLN